MGGNKHPHVQNDDVSVNESGSAEMGKEDEQQKGSIAEAKAASPYDKWDMRTRYTVLWLVSCAGFLGPTSTTIYLPSLGKIERDLDTDSALVAQTMSVYAFVIGVFPLWWGPLADTHGRRPVILWNLVGYTVTSVACGFVPDIYSLIIIRSVQGVCIASLITVGAGAISDTWPQEERGRALGLFGVAPLIGPIVGPIMGGAIAAQFGWRAIFFVLAIIGGVLATLVYFLLPETLPKEKFSKALPRPWRTLRFLKELRTLSVALYFAIVFSVMYAVIIVFPTKAEDEFGLSEFEIGMSYIPFGIGTLVGVVFGGRYADYLGNTIGIEGRLFAAVTGMLMYIPSIFGYAIVNFSKLELVLTFMFCIGLSLTFGRPGGLSYLIQTHHAHSSSITGSVMFTQFMFAFVAASTCVTGEKELGFRPFYLLLSGLAVLFALPLFVTTYNAFKEKKAREAENPPDKHEAMEMTDISSKPLATEV